VQHAIGSWKRAQTLDPNQRPENSLQPLNLTLDLEHAHVSGHSAAHGLTEQINFTPAIPSRGSCDQTPEEGDGHAGSPAGLEPALNTSLTTSIKARSFGASDAPRGK
jgi:hypothetical protein